MDSSLLTTYPRLTSRSTTFSPTTHYILYPYPQQKPYPSYDKNPLVVDRRLSAL
ncbi:hypothetical protein HRbin15_00755 [bacterium HR15]|nr:hypothetical protein HRbin15_00755 [bacterium HR15]